MNKPLLLLFVIILTLMGVILYRGEVQKGKMGNSAPIADQENDSSGILTDTPHLLSIESLRRGQYPGSDIVIEETLSPGSNYQRYIASYKSEGLKIYALLTIPNGQKPENGWPVIIFNHGYIPPSEYRTTERYIAYTDAFSRAGYILFRPDYRGHGNSEGQAAGGYGSNAYTIDVLNAVTSIKRLNDSSFSSSSDPPAGGESRSSEGSRQARTVPIVDPNRIGMWGHSMGGFITLRNMVVSKDVKAGVIWAGVVASYPDLITRWRRTTPSASVPTGARRWRQALVEQYGTPEENPKSWSSISANSYLSDISGPLQLHHGTTDTSVPVEFSETLEKQMKAAGKEVELFTYPGDDHNLANNLYTALERSVAFFDKYLK